MAQEDLPISKYSSCMSMLKLNSTPGAVNLPQAGNATYTSTRSGEDFQACIAEEIHGRLVGELKKASFFSIIIDESTDIAVNKHMVVYVRYVDDHFVPKTAFLKNLTINDPKSTARVLYQHVRDCLTGEELDVSRVLGFGSDGAAVMVGKKGGVAALLRKESPHGVNIHCVAHRFNLATSQASKDIPFLKKIESTLTDLYYHFGGSKSGNRKCELAEIQKVLEDPVLKVKECHQIRWTGFFLAVKAVHTSWGALMTYFRDHIDQKSLEIYNVLRQYQFLAILSMLMDVLPSVNQVSLLLQKRDLDIACLQPALKTLKEKIKKAKLGTAHYQSELMDKLDKTKDKGKTIALKYRGKAIDFGDNVSDTTKVIKEIRENFCDALLSNIKARFPKETSDLTTSFAVLGMRALEAQTAEGREEFGVEEIHTLASFYGEEAKNGETISRPLITKEACLEEWSLAKEVVLQNRYPKHSTQALYKLLADNHGDTFPNLLRLANLAMIMPYHTADCERGFSCQNGILTARRNRLTEASMNVLMTIKSEGGKLEEYDFGPAAALWSKKKDRRLGVHLC